MPRKISSGERKTLRLDHEAGCRFGSSRSRSKRGYTQNEESLNTCPKTHQRLHRWGT